MMKTLLASLLAAASAASAALAQDALLGSTWLTENGEAKVSFFQCGDNNAQLCGALSWLQRQAKSDTPVLDAENPDPELRSRELEGITMLWGFEQDDDGDWRDGKLYKADEGKTYRGNILPQDDGTLKLEGCVFVICKSQTWTRVEP